MQSINILGYGVMGRQIAALFYLGGFEVNIWNDVPMVARDLERCIKLVAKNIPKTGEGKVNYLYDLEKLGHAITIEAALEDLTVKKKLYETISKKNEESYFTNSSSYSPQEIGGKAGLLHFFNPISIGLVETWFPDNQIRVSAVGILEYLSGLGFSLVEVKNNRGSVANYLLFKEISSVLELIEKYGYKVEAVEKIYSKLYSGRNIFNIIDLVGVDITRKIIMNLQEQDKSIYLPKCLEVALQKNILGKKNNSSIRQVCL